MDFCKNNSHTADLKAFLQLSMSGSVYKSCFEVFSFNSALEKWEEKVAETVSVGQTYTMYVHKCWQCFRVGSSLGVDVSFCIVSSRRSCQSIQLCLNALYLVQNIRNSMDTDGLQKKILELSKNAAELQVSISTLAGTKRQPIVYLGLVRGISTSGRQTARNLSVLKNCNAIIAWTV